MCEIKDSLTALEPSRTTHAESSILEDNGILSESETLYITVPNVTMRERRR
ncbi:hypothetical protein ABVT39_021442, partial [Epinephelus coioides]